MSKVNCSMEFEYATSDEAEKILRALEVDNDGYINCSQKGKKISAEVEADTLPSLLHTLNDLLACMATAEKLIIGQE